MAFLLGPEKPALSFLRNIPNQFEPRNGFIMVAWARKSGVGLLHSVLQDYLSETDILVGMANRGTSVEALSYLRTLCRRVYVYHTHQFQTFHPKLYLFDTGESPPSEAILLVGSSNLTGGGLFQNIEGNYTLHLHPSDRVSDEEIYESVVDELTGLVDSPFSQQITTDEEIQDLLQDGYLSTESDLQRNRVVASNLSSDRRGQLNQNPAVTLPNLPEYNLPPLEFRFQDSGDQQPVPQAQNQIPTSPETQSSVERFYVRTLTENDVNKLMGLTPGTAEWDIGQTARDQSPLFWGWPTKYERVERQRVRLEWNCSGVLFSSSTSGLGVFVEIVLWFREQREGHAAEHRVRIGPRSRLLNAVPQGFNTNSLVVLERSPNSIIHDFKVHLLTSNDSNYELYSQFLQHNRPRHRYGYGP